MKQLSRAKIELLLPNITCGEASGVEMKKLVKNFTSLIIHHKL
ncbi:hypothetical protein [Bacillus sp. AFS014408]|nr:hypothetical protein [Bacillus sp. AFS014408]